MSQGPLDDAIEAMRAQGVPEQEIQELFQSLSGGEFTPLNPTTLTNEGSKHEPSDTTDAGHKPPVA